MLLKQKPRTPSECAVFLALQVLFVLLDHLADHLAADAAGLLGGQVAVVAFLQVDAHFTGGLHLELLHSLLGVGVHIAVITGHGRYLLFFKDYDHSLKQKRAFIDGNFYRTAVTAQ